MYMWENVKKEQKTKITLNNTFLLMFGEFKSDQFFVQNMKLAKNLYVVSQKYDISLQQIKCSK